MSSFIKNWTQKEVDNLTTSFKRYRVFVVSLRFLLPIAAAGILFAIVFFAENEDKTTKLTVENVMKDGQKFDADNVTSVGVMENPRFQGVDASNQPYSLLAKQAWQQGKNEIEMREITADTTLKSGTWISLVASDGRYFLAENVANLHGKVDVFLTAENGDNFQIQTSEATLDIKQAIASNNAALSVKSNLANFDAHGFVANREMQTISFKGPIKLVILQE